MRSEEDVPVCRCCGRRLPGDGECIYCGLVILIGIAELIEKEEKNGYDARAEVHSVPFYDL
jgi:hypothetical protein